MFSNDSSINSKLYYYHNLEVYTIQVWEKPSLIKKRVIIDNENSIDLYPILFIIKTKSESISQNICIIY